MVTGSNGLLGQKLTDLLVQDDQIELVATARGINRHPLKTGYTYLDLDVTDKNVDLFADTLKKVIRHKIT